MAGKDRTGVAAMAVHLALGVHRDDIVADYLLTNTAGDPAARIAAGYRTVAATVGDLDEESLRVMMGVEAEYLDIALATIVERSGSVDVWLSEEFGADAALRERLRSQLVA
jgi:protein tyrosine/serine phosphatase